VIGASSNASRMSRLVSFGMSRLGLSSFATEVGSAAVKNASGRSRELRQAAAAERARSAFGRRLLCGAGRFPCSGAPSGRCPGAVGRRVRCGRRFGHAPCEADADRAVRLQLAFPWDCESPWLANGLTPIENVSHYSTEASRSLGCERNEPVQDHLLSAIG
jgi:hypothetical protein